MRSFAGTMKPVATAHSCATVAKESLLILYMSSNTVNSLATQNRMRRDGNVHVACTHLRRSNFCSSIINRHSNARGRVVRTKYRQDVCTVSNAYRQRTYARAMHRTLIKHVQRTLKSSTTPQFILANVKRESFYFYSLQTIFFLCRVAHLLQSAPRVVSVKELSDVKPSVDTFDDDFDNEDVVKRRSTTLAACRVCRRSFDAQRSVNLIRRRNEFRKAQTKIARASLRAASELYS